MKKFVSSTTRFLGPKPWPDISRAVRTAGPRYAAIAYLGADAPELLPLKRGDVLVVNASPAALRAHATSPDALEFFLDKGVEVLSSSTLHAKVIATASRAIIGSANASRTSQRSQEAVIVTSDSQLVANVRDYVLGLVDVSIVNDEFLQEARLDWEKGHARPIPGVSGDTESTDSFLPSPVKRVFLWRAEEYLPTKTEDDLHDREIRRHRKARGPAATYMLEWYRVEESGSLKQGDVLFRFGHIDDELYLFPPAVVRSSEIAIPRSRGAVAYFLRSRVDLDGVLLAEADVAIRSAGVAAPRLETERRINSPAMREALLGLWDLS